MENKIETYISLFLDELKLSYPDIYCEVQYCAIDDSYMIWHNKRDYTCENFSDTALFLVEKLFYENDIMDVGFSYLSTVQPASDSVLEQPIIVPLSSRTSLDGLFEIADTISTALLYAA